MTLAAGSGMQISRLRIAVALLVGGLALVLFLRGVGERRRAEPVEQSDARTAQPGPASETALAQPSVADLAVAPAIAPTDTGSTRTAAESAPLVLTFRILEKGSRASIAGARLCTFEDSVVGTWTTDERGVCDVTLPAGTHHFRLHIEKEGFVHIALEDCNPEGAVLYLTRAATLSGVLRAADTGEPLPGARIALGRDTCEAATAVAGPDGRYVLAGVPLRDPLTQIALEAEQFPREVRELELRSDEPRIEQDFFLLRGIEIHGHVVDWVTGAGIAGAKVEGVVTDPTGTFHGVIRADSSEPISTLAVEAPGYCMLSAGLDSDRLGDEHRFRLPRCAVIEGVVRDRSGRPIARASVSVEEDEDERDRQRQQRVAGEASPLDELPKGWRLYPGGYVAVGATDGDGHYRIESVVPWSQSAVIFARADDHENASGRIGTVPGPGAVTQIDLVLEPAAAPEPQIHGALRLNGVPLWSARGRVRWKGATRSGEAAIFQGYFAAGVEPGEIALDVEVEGLPAEVEGSHVTRTASEEQTFIDLRVPARAITGRVAYSDGSAAGGVEVRASCPLHGAGYNEQVHVSAIAAADGSFALGVPDLARPYVVEVAARNDSARVENVRAGAQGVELVLRVPAHFLFRALDAETRAPIPEHDLELTWKHTEEDVFHPLPRDEHVPDADGWMEDELPAGRFDLCASARVSDHRMMLLRDVWIPASGEPPRIEFALARGIPLEVVLAEGLEAPRGVGIQLLEEERWDHVDGALGSSIGQRYVRFVERSAELHALGPGRYRFKVTPPKIVVEPELVTLEEGVPQRIELRWRAAD